MHISICQSILAVALYLVGTVHAKAVFAHYMVGTITQAHANQDIDDAIAMGLDGFALNIGDPTQSYATTAISYLFEYAATKDFKLFVSMDLKASGAMPSDYSSIFSNYLGSSAWYLGPNGQPMISTFSSGGYNISTWSTWKESLDSKMYFIPDFDETDGYYQAADGWWSYWGGLVDGLFSWEAAWPLSNGYGGLYPGDISPDQTVINGASANQKGYMIALSTLQYKDAYGADIYRAGDLNLPVRMQNILTMSPQPDFVEIITWNDGPESHYIGNVWPESGSSDAYSEPSANFPHTSWQPLLTSFIAAYKSSKPSTSMTIPSSSTAVGALWYKTILQSSVCSSDTQPQNFASGTDSLNWAIILPQGVAQGMQVQAVSNGVVLNTTDVGEGLNFGTATGVTAGSQSIVLTSGGSTSMTAQGGRCVSSGCPDGVYNMNLQVVALAAGNSGASCFS